MPKALLQWHSDRAFWVSKNGEFSAGIQAKRFPVREECDSSRHHHNLQSEHRGVLAYGFVEVLFSENGTDGLDFYTAR